MGRTSGPIRLPDDREVHVWEADLHDLAPRRDTLARSLTQDEQVRAKRFRRDDDRSRFILCRGALRGLLGRYLDRRPETVDITSDNNQKPVLADNVDLAFNLSHARDALLVAVARGVRVGVDIEAVDNGIEIEPLLATVCHINELNRLSGCDTEAARALFFRYWSHKEAYLKALGVGLAGDMHNVEVIFADKGRSTVIIDHDSSRASSPWSVVDWDCFRGYAAAVAVERADARFTRHQLSASP